MKEYTKELARWASELRYEDIPESLIKKLKDHMLDLLGCAVAGSEKDEILNLKKALMAEEGTANVWGTEKRVPMANGMLINGAMSHTVELDDLHKPSKIHAACVVIPPVLTLAETIGASGKDVLKAAAIGYEIVIRMGMALGTDSHRRRGWHATATCGSFGAAAALGSLLKLDPVRMANALGLAGTQTGGLMAYTADGSMSKRLHAGKAGENGWVSAVLAQNGFTGPTYVLEAPDGGYAHAASDKYDLDILLEDLGTVWHAEETGLKYYACCGHIHQAIDAGLRIRKEQGLTSEDIEKVEVATYDVSGMAWGFLEAPKNTVEAQFNIPYAVAAALVDGEASLPQFAETRLNDPQIISLARRISVATDDRYTRRYPAEWCSRVTLTAKDGRVFEKEVCGAKGDPVNPLSYEEITTKFRTLTGTKLSDEQKDQIIGWAGSLEQQSEVGGLNRLLVNHQLT